MGAGASSQASFEQMLACTMILGEAMVQGLDPRFVRFPDMYRLYDFRVGPKKPEPKPFQGGNMIIFVHSPDDDGKFQQIELGSDGDDAPGRSNTTTATGAQQELPAESDANLLVVFIGTDKIVLDKATLNQPNFDNWTPLHSCCHTINAQEAGIAILKELVAQKADLNLVTKRGPGSFSCGWTPLHIACAYGLEALALKLIRAGANVNVANSVKWTPLFEACHRGYSTVAKELLRAGAKHDVICPEFALCPFPGQHPLAEAARQGHVDMIRVLLEWGVDKNAVNKLGWTALHEASYHSRLAIVKMLVVYGADVFAKTEKGSLAKDLTIHSEIRAMLDDLCRHGPAPSSPTKEKLHGAVDAGESGGGDASSSPKKRPSPTKAQSVRASSPLSRKEEYALLGDLPSLQDKAMPSISIQDVDGMRDDDDGKTGDDDGDENGDRDAKASDEAVGSHSSSKPKHHKKKHKKKSSSGQDPTIPPEFKCAVSLKLLKHPLRSPYGHVFERHVVEAWFRDFGNRCPLTGEPLTIHQLVSDDKLKAEIHEWKHGSRRETGSTSATCESKDVAGQGEARAVSSEPPEGDPYDF